VEINARAEDRLSLQEAVTLSHAYQAILEAAYEQHLLELGGDAALLDAVVEIARERGYGGDVNQAVRILQAHGRFTIKATPAGRLAVWRNAGSAP